MTDILYQLQHHQNSDGIYDPEEFLNIVSFQAPELRQFLICYINQQIQLENVKRQILLVKIEL